MDGKKWMEGNGWKEMGGVQIDERTLRRKIAKEFENGRKRKNKAATLC